MKILQVWEWAGIASIYSKYLKALGHECLVLKSMDKFGFLGFYEQPYWRGDVICDSLDLAKDYDVIHIHSRVRLSKLMRDKYPNKKIIHHYHGSEARGGGGNVEENERMCDHLFVSTKDLLQYVPSAEWLPNIVDIDHFAKRTLGKGMVCISNDARAKQKAQQVVLDKEVQVTYFDRSVNPISYKYMPEFLKQYDSYLDVKLDAHGEIVYEYSTLALQAVAMGLKVMQADGKILKELPDQNKPEHVISRLLEVYNE